MRTVLCWGAYLEGWLVDGGVRVQLCCAAGSVPRGAVVVDVRRVRDESCTVRAEDERPRATRTMSHDVVDTSSPIITVVFWVCCEQPWNAEDRCDF